MDKTKTYFHCVALKYVLYYMAATYTLALMNKPRAIIWYSLILASVILLSNRRYFPYLSKLVISESRVEKMLFGHVKISMENEKNSVVQLRLYKTLFLVFLDQPRPYITITEAAKLQRKGKAIIYPYLPQMKNDFPELFEHITPL